MSLPENLPVAVIGGGPVGLAAAAHLIERGVPVKVYEAGKTVAASVRDWGHVRLFSPWKHNTDPAATAILREHGWQEPPGDAFPTGGDLYEAYPNRLCAALDGWSPSPDADAHCTGASLERGRHVVPGREGSVRNETLPPKSCTTNGLAR